MNSKIKNYVDVLFNDIPQTRKAAELKEEILSNLNEHFEAHIAEGKSENQAYTESLADLGDVDELLESLAPERELKPKIDDYRKKAAKYKSIAVMLYMFGAILITCIPGTAAIFGLGADTAKFGIIGFAGMMICAAIATGILIYTKNCVPQEVEPFLVRKSKLVSGDAEADTPFWASFWKLYWLVITIIYLFVSFTTFAWHITWIIWLIASAVKMAIQMFKKDDGEI
ncbi:MAG: hypothetical protein ILP07_09155 [Treponema sp.]|nr:hypothetical protein [Treponema sp.]